MTLCRGERRHEVPQRCRRPLQAAAEGRRRQDAVHAAVGRPAAGDRARRRAREGARAAPHRLAAGQRGGRHRAAGDLRHRRRPGRRRADAHAARRRLAHDRRRHPRQPADDAQGRGQFRALEVHRRPAARSHHAAEHDPHPPRCRPLRRPGRPAVRRAARRPHVRHRGAELLALRHRPLQGRRQARHGARRHQQHAAAAARLHAQARRPLHRRADQRQDPFRPARRAPSPPTSRRWPNWWASCRRRW